MASSSTPRATLPVCIIGAGPAGLSAARALRRLGIPYDQYERHSDVGGIWDLDNPGTPMYESAHFISSCRVSGFFGHPMSETFPDYPSHRQILSYTRDFTRHFGLRDAIRFNTAVRAVTGSGEDWTVTTDDGASARYRAVIHATGVTWTPRIPDHPGGFDGEIRHSVTYRDPAEFRGKRVLIVGLGNSGADIACDAAANADAAFVSVRRGYHLVPKHLFGLPTDEWAARGPQIPLRFERPVMRWLLRLMQGDLTRYGLPKPDHQLFDSHPLLNSQLLHHLQHGDVAIRPDVERLSGSRVHFVDGGSEEIDLILYATGYDWSMPYLDNSFHRWENGRPEMYLTAFNRLHHNLIGLGYLETNSSAFTLFDHVSNIVAQYLSDQIHHPARAAAFDTMIDTDRPDLSGGLNFVASARHQSYVEVRAFRGHLAAVRRRMGWTDLTPGMFDALATEAVTA